MQKITKLMIAVIALVVLSITVFPQTLNVLGKSPEKPKSYYLDEIQDTTQKVRALTKEPVLVFFLCSDVHYNTIKTDNLLKLDSVTDMTTNMAALNKQIKVDGLICLGDIVDAKPPHDNGRDKTADRLCHETIAGSRGSSDLQYGKS